MRSSRICTLCKKKGKTGVESRRKCKCRIFTVCRNCETNVDLEKMDVIECKVCKNLLCSAIEGKCETRDCEGCDQEVCKDCMPVLECGCDNVCRKCAEHPDFECIHS